MAVSRFATFLETFDLTTTTVAHSGNTSASGFWKPTPSIAAN